MTMAAPPALFDLGRVISRTFGVVGRNLVTFLVLSVVLAGLPLALVSLLQFAMMSQVVANPLATPTTDQILAPFAIGVATFIVSTVSSAVLQGALIHGTVSDLAGRRVSLGECLGTGLRSIVPLVAIGFISAICIGLGLVLLIVPGVLLALAWSVAAPAEVAERRGVFGALGRSLELTRDHRAAMFGLAVMVIIVEFVISVVFGAAAGISMAAVGGLSGNVIGPAAIGRPNGFFIAQTLVSLVQNSVNACIGSAGVASIYYELRLIKEGIGAEQLASVFD